MLIAEVGGGSIVFDMVCMIEPSLEQFVVVRSLSRLGLSTGFDFLLS